MEASHDSEKQPRISLVSTAKDGISLGAHGTLVVHSCAGVGTTCYVEGPKFKLAIDMGACFHRVFVQEHVFITHGHVDHIQAITAHSSRRNLCGMSPATYTMPAHLLPHVQEILNQHSIMQQDHIPANLRECSLGEKYSIKANFTVRPFQTFHRVPSFGYIVEENRKRLKEEFKQCSREEIVAMRKEGRDILAVSSSGIIAFTGDTTIEVFEENPELFTTEILVVEVTYVDSNSYVSIASERGHIHLDQLVQLAPRFENKMLVFMHFSARYQSEYLLSVISEKCVHFKPEIVICPPQKQ